MTQSEHLTEPVLQFARRDFTALNQDLTVAEALEALRQLCSGSTVIQFF